MIHTWTYKEIVFSLLKAEEIPHVVTLLHDPEVEQYLWFAPITLDGFSAFCLPLIEAQQEAFVEGKYPVSAAFTLRKSGELLGVCGLNEMIDAHQAASIGYQLGRSAWGKGSGTACLEFLIHYAKHYLKLRKLFGDCVTANIASARIMEKCGFSLEGVLKEKYQLDGKLHDNSWFGLNLAEAPELPEGLVRELA